MVVLLELDAAWRQKVDDFNDGRPNHPDIEIRWIDKAIKRIKTIYVHEVPIHRWIYEPRWQVGALLNNCPPGMEKISYYIEGSGGMWFVKLFNWQRQDTGDFLDLDDRIFECLGMGDMTRHGFFEEIEEQEEQEELAMVAEAKSMAFDTAGHFLNYDNPTFNMNPEVKQSGGWRWRNR